MEPDVFALPEVRGLELIKSHLRTINLHPTQPNMRLIFLILNLSIDHIIQYLVKIIIFVLNYCIRNDQIYGAFLLAIAEVLGPWANIIVPIRAV